MPSWDDWLRVCYHEAGHGVATIANGEAAQPLALRCVADSGELMAQGRFRSSATWSPDVPFMVVLQKLASGFVAEEIQYGNHTIGANKDKSSIQEYLRFCRVMKQVHVQNEHEDNYPGTRALLSQHWDAVTRLAYITLHRFWHMNLYNIAFPHTQILSANAVDRVFLNSPMSCQEHADAEYRAYFYSLDRGNGVLPPFEFSLAQDDFCKAAGDIIGATP